VASDACHDVAIVTDVRLRRRVKVRQRPEPRRLEFDVRLDGVRRRTRHDEGRRFDDDHRSDCPGQRRRHPGANVTKLFTSVIYEFLL
jgi:hypothetical protein